MKGVFITGIDLAELGERECTVRWEGYRAIRRAEDDFDEMGISVSLDIDGQAIDITALLTASAKDRIIEEAWAEMPSRAEIENERADYAYQQWRDARLECCAS